MTRTGDEIESLLYVNMEENLAPRSSPRSLHSTIGTPVRFINRSRSRVKVLWLDYQGEQVLYSTLEPLSGPYDVNTYVTHPWIALEETTNAVMLLNFRKIYFPVSPEVRHIESDNRSFYVRSEVVITPNGKAIRDLSPGINHHEGLVHGIMLKCFPV